MAEIFSDKILVEANSFEQVCFHAEIDRWIEISAWEVNKEYFDIYLIRKDEVKDDYFRDEGVMISEVYTNSFNKYHNFSESCEVCIVLSNPKMSGRAREIHLRLTRVKFQKKRRINLQSTTIWKFVLVLTLLLPVLSAAIVFSLTNNSLLAGFILTGGYAMIGVISRLYNKESRAKLGLKDK